MSLIRYQNPEAAAWPAFGRLSTLRDELDSLFDLPYHRESRPRDFRRTFELDPSIDTGRIAAKIDQGVVMLTLPKAEQVKPRKIKVD